MSLFEPDEIFWPRNREKLFHQGRARVFEFLKANELPPINVSAPAKWEWWVDACAYYRQRTIYICVEKCALPALEHQPMAWSWPGSVSDREPFGVMCHELGHHADVVASDKKGKYGGDYSVKVMEASGEKPITSYAPNPWEWFAEMFRLFVTNHTLLQEIRPRTYEILMKRWKPVGEENWETQLGVNVPPRILSNLEKKVTDARRNKNKNRQHAPRRAQAGQG